MTIETLKQLFKFSWAQAFSDTNGKSSASTLTYFIATMTGCIGFLYSLFRKDANAMMWASGIITIGIGAFTGQKIVNGAVKPLDVSVVTKPPTVQQTVTETPPTTTTETTITPAESEPTQ